jgi:glycosyltransferase involved in cell wall biosynthesis
MDLFKKNGKNMRNTHEIKVSVIVPVYNVEKFLAKCLDTLVNQTLCDIEIICVNDGSFDNSTEILKQYAEKYQQLSVVNQENLGLSAARNTGMAMAKGEFIGLIDSDDWVELNYFEELFNVAKKYDADIACCGFSCVYPSSSIRNVVEIEKEAVYESTRDKFRITRTPNKNHVFNKIYRRSALEAIGLKFKPGVYFEDIIFTPRALFFTKKLATTPNTLYFYRVNRNSIMRGEKTNKKQLDSIEARRDFVNFANEHYITFCDEKTIVQKKIVHRFLGIPIIKIYKWETISAYYLFGIKIWEIRHS